MKSLFKMLTLLCLLIVPAVVTAAPTVITTSPADGATEVAITTPVTATFSEAMKEASITSGSLPLTRYVGVKAVSAGSSHTVALKGDGTVVAWGDNGYGQTTTPPALTGVVAVAAGDGHTVALKGDGTVLAWGNNGQGQIGVSAGLTGVVAVAAGNRHTLALKGDGTVVAWGLDQNGQSSVPAGLTGVVAIAGGEAHTVALKSDGTVVAWGLNNSYQTSVPAGLTDVTAVAAGGSHTVAIKGDGTVVAWGLNNSGQTNVPAGLTGVTAVAAGKYHTVALKGDGTLVAWGDNYYGQASVPVGLTGVVGVAAGPYHTVVIKGDGTLVAWGANYYGQSRVPAALTGVVSVSAGNSHTVAVKGDGTVVAWGPDGYGLTSVPAGLTGVVAVAAGVGHTSALKGDGTVVAWGGTNNYGQISVPAGLTGVTAVAAGGDHTVVLKGDGTVVAWGANASGQSSVPAGLTGVVAITAGMNHTAAVKGDGTVVAWGDNGNGQSSVPAGLAGVVSVAAGWNHTVALKGDGTVVAWGQNGHGQTSVPAGLSGVTAIAAGFYHTVALKSDGTVVAWGFNGYGQTSMPAGLTWVVAIAAGGYHTVAVKGDGTVVAWGNNENGQSSVPADPYRAAVAATYSYDMGNSTLTITPAAPLAYNTTYTATATTGIKNAVGTAVAADAAWSFKTVDKKYAITFSPTAGGTLSGSTSQAVSQGESTTPVTAVPDTGYHFVNWTGTNGFATTIANPLTVANVAADQAITAHFAINTYPVTFASGGNGTLTGTVSQTVNYNASATPVTAVPATGYHFVNWTGTSGFVTTTDNPLTVANVTAGQTITANFAINSYTVTFASDGHGTLSGTVSQTVNYNSSLTPVLAIPATGYAFANWTGTGGFVATTANPLTVANVAADQAITANFVINVTITTKDATKPVAFKGGKGKLSFTASATISLDSLKAAISATAPWITLDLANLRFAKGKGSLPYTVAENSEPASRSGTITIGNDTYAINQAPHPCVITSAVVDPLTPLPAAGGVQSLVVNVEPNSCQWKVASYSVDRDTWFATVWSYPAANTLLSGDQTLVGTVAPNTTGKALSNKLVIMTADGKSKKTVTLKQAK